MKNSSKSSESPAKYKLLSTKSFEKDFRKLNLESKRRTDREIRQLQDNPYLGKPLHGDLKGRHSLRIGDCRVIYAVDEGTKTITLIAVGHRKKIYKPLTSNRTPEKLFV